MCFPFSFDVHTDLCMCTCSFFSSKNILHLNNMLIFTFSCSTWVLCCFLLLKFSNIHLYISIKQSFMKCIWWKCLSVDFWTCFFITRILPIIIFLPYLSFQHDSYTYLDRWVKIILPKLCWKDPLSPTSTTWGLK